MKKIILYTLLQISFLSLFSTGEPATYFNIFVPPNNDNVQRNVCLIVTAIYDSTSFSIIDDNMDGDDDDSKSGILMAGQSYVLYIKDNGINDDARYASGGVLKQDGDYFIITSDKLVFASQSTDSDWQHDWVPSINKSSLGEKFIIYSPKNSYSNRDVNVFAYEDNTTVTIRDITKTANTTSTSNYTNVDYFQQNIVAQVQINRGEDIIHFRTEGRDILETGKTYVVESNKPITVQYGALWTNSADGGGYVPASSGTSSGELFYFTVPYQFNNNQEIRIVSWSDNNDIELSRFSGGSWISLKSWSVDSLEPADWVGRDYGATYATMFRVACTPGKKVSVFEANWLETGSPGTSDIATMVSSKHGTTSGKQFLVYMAPPGNENRVKDPFTGQLFGQQLTHVYLFSKDTANVTVKDAYTGGSKINRSYTILPGRYADCYLTLSEWRSIYNGDGKSTSGPERPYLIVESDANISVMNTNFNDNWMMYFGSSQEQSFSQESSSSSSSTFPGDTVRIVSDLVFNSTDLIEDVAIEVVVGSGLIPSSSEFNNVTDGSSIQGEIASNDDQSIATFENVPDIDPTKTYNITTDVVLQVSYNDGIPIPENTVINIETVVTGTIDGEIQQSVTTEGVGNQSNNTDALLFTELTNLEIVQENTNSWTASWVDFNGDGYDDLYTTDYSSNTTNKLYKNNTDGTFTEVTSGKIITEKGGSIASTWADIDNDNDRDCFVAVNLGSKSDLFLNNADETFTKINSDPSVNSSRYHHGASWIDFDNDGNLDLFLCDYLEVNFNQLFKGNGDGTFVEVTDQPITLDAGRSLGASWVDYNNDGFLDLFVPNGNFQNNNLYKNLGGGKFEKILEGDIVNDGVNCVASCWGDYDNDGDMDLFVATSSNAENLLYNNNGDETFTKVTTGSVVTDKGSSHGCNWMDVDNDGDLDLFVTNGPDESKFLYINDGTGNFSRNDNEAISSAISNSYGTCWSDYDRDGDVDLFMSTHSGEKDRFFINNGNDNNWLALKLVGTNSNVSAIGAKVRVKSNNIWQTRELNSQSGLGGQNSLNLHYGLGGNSVVDSIEIRWPSGFIQYRTADTSNQYLVIIEEDASIVSGDVFKDSNGNCIKDSFESGIAGVPINISPGSRTTVSDANGAYFIRLEEGDYTINQSPGSYWGENCVTSHSVSITSDNQTLSNNDFGNEAIQLGVDLSVDIASTAQRKGFRNNVVLTYNNLGTETSQEDVIEVDWSSDLVPLSSEPQWDSIYNNKTFWYIPQIASGGGGLITIIDSASISLTVGDSVPISAFITENSNELDVTNNSTTINEEVVGAIDPNDILVSPKGEGEYHYIPKDQVLTYKIRFQNVGTYYAQHVEVKNSIPSNLDLNTLKINQLSHDAYYLREGNNITWSFRDICLPDSNQNEPLSHGFIEYSIQPLRTIRNEEVIMNHAEIKFDFEAPIKTNIVFNTIQPKPENLGLLAIYPNPMNIKTTLIIESPLKANCQLIILNQLGQQIFGSFVTVKEGVNKVNLDLPNIKSGVYTVYIKGASSSFAGKLIKQ